MRYPMLVFTALLLAACGDSACEREYNELCDICPKNDANALLCKCLQDGVLTKADGKDGQFDNDDEAQQECDKTLYGLHYQGDESAASCRANKAYLDKWGADVCSELGFRDN
jgi:hypothetical protein